MASRTALLLGATGLVGRHCLDELMGEAAYGRIVTLGRRPIASAGSRHVHHVVDFDHLERHADFFEVDDVFCCLGATIKKAGSREAFRRVDVTYPVEAARLAAEAGAGQYLLVSALGASERSLFFYNRIKGEAEAAIRSLSFRSVYIFRPSLLRGERADARWKEQVSEKVLDGLAFLLRGPLRPYRPIAASAVARAMVRVAGEGPGGVRVYETEAIRNLAGGNSGVGTGLQGA